MEVLGMSRASCHSAGLKAKLEMVWQVQFLPGIGTLKRAVSRKQSRRSAASQQPLVLSSTVSTLADD